MQINFKKIASVATSALMIGSTVALAAAANYPAPFNSAQAAVVYGSDGAATDLVAASDIRDSLRGSNGTPDVPGSVTGEAYPLFTGSTQLYLNDSLTKVRGTITETEMPMVLADGDFSGNVDADFTQTIVLGTNPRITFAKQPDTSDDPVVGVSLSTQASSALYNATITFDRAVNFTNTESQGETLEIFGREFTVGADTSSTELVLFQSSETIFLSRGGESPSPSKAVTAEGKEYTVELISASDSAATIQVTDSSGRVEAREVNEDRSRKINGLEIAVKNADESEATGTVSAQITVGSQKMIFTDGSNVQVGTSRTNLEGTRVSFTSTGAGSTDDITKITVQVFANDTDMDAILAGESFVDPVFGALKIDFTGLNIDPESSSRAMISVDPSGDKEMNVRATNQNTEKSITFARNESGQTFRLAYGSDGREVFTVREMAMANKSNYVMVGNEEDGRLVRVSTITNQTSGNGYSEDRVEFVDVFSGNTYSTSITSEGTGTVSIGGKSYTVSYWDNRDAENDEIVRLNYPDSSGNQIIVFPTIETQNGAKLAFYEPQTVQMDNYDGLGGDVSSFSFPDGDDYNTALSFAYGAGGNMTLSGAASAVLNAIGGSGVVNSTTFAAGQLTYNITATGTNQTKIFLVDPIAGGNINNPALIIFEEEEDDGNVENALVVTLEGAGLSTDGIGVSTVRVTNTAFRDLQLESNDDLTQTMTKFGTLVTIDSDDTDQKSATISYPDEQVQAMIYIAEESATITGGSSGSGSSSMGSVLVRDSEVNSVSSRNMIVVGGSCVNTVAAQLLSLSGANRCGAGFTSATGVGNGEFLIQTFDSPFSNGKVAMLVAGYNAQDTINAGKYLTTQTVDTSVGKKYKGTSQTQATLVTS